MLEIIRHVCIDSYCVNFCGLTKVRPRHLSMKSITFFVSFVFLKLVVVPQFSGDCRTMRRLPLIVIVGTVSIGLHLLYGWTIYHSLR